MGRIKAFLGLAVCVTVLYLGWMIIPVYVAFYQFQDGLVTTAKYAATSINTDEQIHDEVLKKAKELDVPVRSEDIKVHREGNAVDITADYVVVLNFIGGKQKTFAFSPSCKEKSAQK
jgi:hypothetical protein